MFWYIKYISIENKKSLNFEFWASDIFLDLDFMMYNLGRVKLTICFRFDVQEAALEYFNRQFETP